MVVKMESALKSKKYENLNKSVFNVFSGLFEKKGNCKKHVLDLLRILNENRKDDVQYIINRLVRGLGSARVHTQSCSFSLLVCLLKHVSDITVENLLEAADKELEKCGNLSKNEEIEVYTGSVLLYGAIIHSGLLFNFQLQSEILNRLMKLGNSKSYLSFLSFSFLTDLVKETDELYFNETIWPVAKQQLNQTLCNQNLDSLYFILVVKNKFPSASDNLKDILGQLEKSLTMLCHILLTTHSAILIEHPVFEEVGQFINGSKELLLKFWTTEVQAELSKITPNKEHRTMLMFFYTLKYLKHGNLLPHLLTPKFITILIKVLSLRNDKNPLNKDNIEKGKQLLQEIIHVLRHENIKDKVRVETIKKLLLYPGNIKFEQKTGSRCIQLITLQCGVFGVKKLAEIYSSIISGDSFKVINDSGGTDTWNSNERVYILSIFTKLINHPSMKEEKVWKVEQIKFIFKLAFFKDVKVTSDVQKYAKISFYNSLNFHFSKLEDLISALNELIEFVKISLIENKVILNEEGMETWEKMMPLIKKLQKKHTKNGSLKGIYLLLLHMGLQLFNDSSLAKESLEDLNSCYKRIKDEQKTFKTEATQSEEPHWIEVTVDLILSILSRENKLWRHVIACIFPHLSDQLTINTFQQIIDALDPNSENNPLHQHMNNLSEENNDDAESDISENEDDSVDIHEESMEEEETVNEKFRIAVRDALGYSAAFTDDESEDMDNMNEEEEERLNIKLGEAFKFFKMSHKRNKKKQTKSEASLMHFRLRVLDLLEIYINNKPSMIHCLNILLPLFTLLEATIKDYLQKPLQDRLENILKKIAHVKKFSSIENVDQNDLLSIFKAIVDRDQLSGLMYSEISARVSDCCIFLIRCSQQLLYLYEGTDKLFSDEYIRLLNLYFKTRDCKLPVSVFQSALKITWVGNWQLINVLFDIVVDPQIRLFKKNKAVELLHTFYLNQRQLSCADVKQFVTLHELEQNFVNRFKNMFNVEKNALKTKQVLQSFLSNVIKLITLAYNVWLKYQKKFNKPIPWVDILLLIHHEVKLNVNNKKIKKLAATLGADVSQFTIHTKKEGENLSHNTVVNGSFGELGQNGIVANIEKKQKKERKLSQEKKHLKKISQEMRTAMHSKGLQDVNFSEFINVGVDPTQDTIDTSNKRRKIN